MLSIGRSIRRHSGEVEPVIFVPSPMGNHWMLGDLAAFTLRPGFSELGSGQRGMT
jgi:hypothetical protein